jgi:Xaa-Pro aminopeptidase
LLRKSANMNGPEKLKLLRSELAKQALTGFVVPLTDEHMSEYVGGYAKRLEWLTGFAGSAGSAIVLADCAAMFTDGRYTLQVRAQVEAALYSYEPVPETTHAEWLSRHVKSGDVIGYDPWFHTKAWVNSTRHAVEAKGAKLIPTPNNPIDAVWENKPAPSLASILPHPIEFTGSTSADKRAAIAADLSIRKIDTAVISALDSVAWLFNVRGTDVERTPVPRSYALLNSDSSATLFAEPQKITPELRAHLGENVHIRDRADFIPALKALASAKKSVLFDPESTVVAVLDALQGATIIEARDPCIMPKARKNDAELNGTRAAHARDGAAIAKLLHWVSINAETLDELTVVDKLYEFRAESNLLRDASFDTISGAGPNGAIVHYRSTPATNRKLQKGELFLLDSGGQYLDGTTDITRTIAIGTPNAEMRERFTRVLKGHIALALARFPKGTSGRQLDTLARYHLWQAGLDYDHGTGHGVGSYLAVHEGPQRIAKMGTDIPLEYGMILSNEPGYYKTDAYGIRIENLIVVREDKRPGDEREMLAFETITLAPLDASLIDETLLSPPEIAWVNAYHERVRAALAPQLSGDAATWMHTATASL